MSSSYKYVDNPFNALNQSPSLITNAYDSNKLQGDISDNTAQQVFGILNRAKILGVDHQTLFKLQGLDPALRCHPKVTALMLDDNSRGEQLHMAPAKGRIKRNFFS